MVEPQASRFWTAALQSGLVSVETLTPCWEAIPAEKRAALEHLDRRLARQAVLQNVLTLWQAQQLLAGRTSGFRVDRYVLLDLIGQGGMGRVYLARDTRLSRRVALKILSPERMNNPRAIARFQREARLGAQLQHENLVRIYDLGEIHGRYFLVMEFIEGKTIGAIIAAHGSILPPAAATLTRQVALGLEHAHRKGLVHRDVNPSNVLVTRDGIAKLADLGLAIDLTEVDRLTREGATVGTFDYLAPEQARYSHSVDNRSDIYSLGCSIYHMIAGHVPFPSPSRPEKLFAHQFLEPKPLEELIPDIAPGLVEVVRKMMRKLPNDRFATPLHVAQALEPFIEDQRRAYGENGRVDRPVSEKPGQSPGVSPSPSPLPSPFPSPSPSGEVQAGPLAGAGVSANLGSPVGQAPPKSAAAREPIALVHGSNQAPEQAVTSGPSLLTPIDHNLNRAGRAKIATEKEPVAGSIDFEARPGATPDSLEPVDFAVKSAGPAKVGADPVRVGPAGEQASRPSP
jgi:serine/threonine protein kinase